MFYHVPPYSEFLLAPLRGVNAALALHQSVASKGVGGVKEVKAFHLPSPPLIPSSASPPPSVAHSLSFSRSVTLCTVRPGRRNSGIWKRICGRSVCCGRFWPLWCPVSCRSWWRWCRRRSSPSPPCWSQRLWWPLWLVMQRTACHTTWAASKDWSTRRSA